MNIYRIFSIVMLLGWTTAALGQGTGQLSGFLKDPKGAGVGFANVAVLKTADSTFVAGGLTDTEGAFAIKSPGRGSYLIRFAAIGFARTDMAPFEVTGESFSKNFGTITLQEDVKMLQEVTVQALRPTIVTHPDKMVMNVEGSALASGSTAFEMLTKAPGVWIDQNGNIQLNGKAGVRVMIDGRMSYLSAKELQNKLEGMSAENIKDIEVISNPSAKYDAEGTSGIININLRKNTVVGLNGSVNLGTQFNGLHGHSGGGTLKYKKGKWSSYANLDGARRPFLRIAQMNREFNDEETSIRFDQTGREETFRLMPSLRLGTDLDITKKHSVGAMLKLSFFDANHHFRTQSYLTNGNPLQDSLITADNKIHGQFVSGTANLHYLGKLSPEGTTLTADLDYVKLVNRGNSDFVNRFELVGNPATAREDLLASENPTQYDIYSAKVDFTRPLADKKSSYELGAKASHVRSENELRFFQILDRPVPDLNRTSHFIYTENILAAYANFKTKLGDKWSVQGGLRAEQTLAEGYSVTLDQPTPRNYLNFFPSLFVQQKVSGNYSINYNFSRRIDRPRYESLNPFIFYLDPYTWAQGNPYLRPQYTNSFQVTQTLKQKYILVLGYALTKDAMAEVPVQDNETRTTVFSQRNVDNFENISANLVVPVKVLPKWEMNNNLTVAYQNYSMVLQEQALKNDQLFFMGQSNHTVQLPEKIKMEVNAGYQSAGVYGLYKISSNWWVDAGLKRSFLNDKLDLGLNVTDIFRTRRIQGAANFNGNINTFNQYFGAQSVRLNLSYRFNKGEKFEMKNRNSNLEELRRAGGN